MSGDPWSRPGSIQTDGSRPATRIASRRLYRAAPQLIATSRGEMSGWDPVRVGVEFHAVPRLARQHDFPGLPVEDGWRTLHRFDDPRHIGMPWHASPLVRPSVILTARLPETGCGRQRQMSRPAAAVMAGSGSGRWHLGQFDEGVQASGRVQGGQPGDGDEHHGRADQQHAGARRRPEQRGHPPGHWAGPAQAWPAEPVPYVIALGVLGGDDAEHGQRAVAVRWRGGAGQGGPGDRARGQRPVPVAVAARSSAHRSTV